MINWCNFRSKKNRILSDFALSVIASVVYTFARQLVVFPILAAKLSASDYGTLLTVIALVNVCNALLGGTLNNIKLIQDSEYKEKGVEGDFLFLCNVSALISLAFCATLAKVFNLGLVTSLLLIVYTIGYNYYQYGTAYFRLALDFKKQFIANVVTAVAYTLAAFIFANPIWWPMIFVIGDGAGLLYTAITTKFLQEASKCTILLKATVGKSLALMSSNVVANLLMYADRMIIYPILGSAAVSYYTVASFFGKSAGMVMVPIAGVLLGYFAQKDFKASKKLFALVNGLSLLCLAVFLLGCFIFAPWFTKLLYPTLFDGSKAYIFLANLGAVVGIAGNMAQPMVLKCCNILWNLFVQCIYAIVYVALSLWLLPIYGLLGFCWATIIANFIRLLSLYAIGFAKFE